MNRPTKFDWLVYRVFRFFWNPILHENDILRQRLGASLYFYKDGFPKGFKW